MERLSIIKRAAVAAVAAFGLVAFTPGSASGGGVRVDINLGGNPPPPPPAEIVVVERPAPVVVYETYHTGYPREPV